MTTKQAVLIGVGGALVLAAVVASGLLFKGEACRDFRQGMVQVGNKKYAVAVAGTDTERTRGLIGCAKLPADSGMYFPYPSERVATYWMKGMQIPLDIVWIAGGRVVGVEENVPPADALAVDPPQYRSPRPVDAVLELAAGVAREDGIAAGTLVQFVPR